MATQQPKQQPGNAKGGGGGGQPPKQKWWDADVEKVQLDGPSVVALLSDTGYTSLNEKAKRIGMTLAGAKGNVKGKRITKSTMRDILNSFQVILEIWPREHDDPRADEVAAQNAADGEGAAQKATQEPLHDIGRRIARLQYLLTYQAGRQTNEERQDVLGAYATTLGYGIQHVVEENPPKIKTYTRLVDFVEAVTAYHRAYAQD